MLGILIANFRDRLVEFVVGFGNQDDPVDVIVDHGWLLPVLGGAIVVILIGMAIFFRYPLTEQTFTRMVAETAARRAARVASGGEVQAS